MKKLTSTLPNMLLSLTLICCAAALLLAFVFDVTSGPIAESQMNTLLEGINKVSPEYDNNPYEEAIEVEINGGIVKIYPARKGGELQGVAAETFTKNGFAGLIRILVGINNESNIIDYTVLQHAETPGLGDQMQEWFRVEGTNQSVLGKNLSTPLSVSKDGGEVDAITAATISSRAFLDALNTAQTAVTNAKAEGKLK
ncbi:RnfABCDGE type electron transport complex subunit G [Porphyromonadaceae bacterium W3.11]|nr:RnfABCDGE type electron transport complex subunit G [Porphyromonadaceae bacterium W3.11]